MTRQDHNAFLQRASGTWRNSRTGLTRLLAPMRAELTEAPEGVILELDPMRAVDALAPWQRLSASTGAATLVCGPAGDTPLAGAGRSLLDMLDHLGIRVLDAFSAQQVVLSPAALEQAAIATQLDGLVAVLIDGPIDHGDATAISAAIDTGRSPLAVELRALAAMRVIRNRSIVLDARDTRQAASFVAANFRHYLAALRNSSADGVSAPEPPLIERLLSLNGCLSVRPIETEIYSTSIDVGISTSTSDDIRPANESLIYDIYCNTWHGE